MEGTQTFDHHTYLFHLILKFFGNIFLYFGSKAHAKNTYITSKVQLLSRLLLDPLGPCLHNKDITRKTLANWSWGEGGLYSNVCKSIHAHYLQKIQVY